MHDKPSKSRAAMAALLPLASLLAVMAIPTATADGCPDEDQSGGVGGQHISCSFDCAGPGGTFEAFIDADDSSAKVSVTGICGAAEAHCSGRNKCSDTKPYSGDHSGSCEGDTDEAFDDGVYINCEATADTSGGDIPGPGGLDEYCPVTSPMMVCIQFPPKVEPIDLPVPPQVETPPLHWRIDPPGGVQIPDDLIKKLCLKLICGWTGPDLDLRSAQGSSSAHILAHAGEAVGIVCNPSGTCAWAPVHRTIEDGRVSWSI